MWDIICPFCKIEFEDEPWDSGECPGCGKEYYWDEQYDPDTGDAWETIEWDRFDREYLERIREKKMEKI